MASLQYVDPKTGELHTVTDYVKEHGEPGSYRGPPSVDIIIQSIHADTVGCVYRAARLFPWKLSYL
ncbi:unnamed protein product [Clonostachys rhizophaga]|uniref:Uncharacterized protein n=1 Tax=Clonostachys rhizophaga TaxID=160324 RepID=A0A9N9VDF4_9HYPO|nr:unnamed protein product [Clonostachys rhizophaga]